MSPETPKKPEEEHKPIKSLRTFAGDVEEAIEKEKFSTATIALAEQKRREERHEKIEEFPEVKNRTSLYIYGAIGLFVLSIVLVAGVYIWRNRQDKKIVERPVTPISFTKLDTFPIAGKNKDALQTEILSQQKSFNSPINSVLFINFVDTFNKADDVSSLISLIFPNIPSSLARSFAGNYMFGIYAYDVNAPFIILNTNDYALSYSGMLKWENSIPYDLGKIFNITPNASTTLKFIDKSIKNYDMRVLTDDARNTLLVYSFINRNTLVITKNENIFSAIVAKYEISKQTR